MKSVLPLNQYVGRLFTWVGSHEESGGWELNRPILKRMLDDHVYIGIPNSDLRRRYGAVYSWFQKLSGIAEVEGFYPMHPDKIEEKNSPEKLRQLEEMTGISLYAGWHGTLAMIRGAADAVF